MSPNIIKVNYPKSYQTEVNGDNMYEEELAKLTSESFANASTTNTLKHIKNALAKSLRKQYGIKDKDELTNKVNALLALHGLSDERFDPMGQFAKYMTTQLNDISIDDNANKDSVSIKGTLKELELPFDKLIGYDYIFRMLKELYGKDEAERISGEMYNFSLALGDSTNALIPYCWAFDASKIVMLGRQFGQLPSKPAKRVSSYIAALCETIHQMSSHLAGAISLGTFFMDVTHLLIYKQRVPYDKLINNAAFRKQLENEFQQFIHSCNSLSRNGIESPFTNVSIFDKEKLSHFINDENYGWYFPKNIKVLADNELGDENGKISKDAFEKFIVNYIFEVQKIFVELFDKGDPSQNGINYRFPVVTVNISKHNDEHGNPYVEEGNELLEYIVKKDISKYNLFTSSGERIASCCRMINDKEMMDQLGSTMNSFGGSGGASLGSHRVVTINFARLAYQANSYDEYKSLLKARVDDASKVLKAHKVLLYKLTDMGMEPFIKMGFIDLGRMFSTFGMLGIYEADIILKDRFGNKDFDYMLDILECFKEYTIEAGTRENLIINREEIPGESCAPKLFKSDNILFGNPYGFPEFYANQFVPLYAKVTIAEKMKIEGKYERYLSGGVISHLQIGSDVTSTQAKAIIMEAVKSNCEHFALNRVISRCTECGAVEKANWKECPHCHSEKVQHMTRVVGFFTITEQWNKTRREKDFPSRHFYDLKELEK